MGIMDSHDLHFLFLLGCENIHNFHKNYYIFLKFLYVSLNLCRFAVDKHPERVNGIFDWFMFSWTFLFFSNFDNFQTNCWEIIDWKCRFDSTQEKCLASSPILVVLYRVPDNRLFKWQKKRWKDPWCLPKQCFLDSVFWLFQSGKWYWDPSFLRVQLWPELYLVYKTSSNCVRQFS